MATNFPSSLDSLTNPQAGDTLANPSHSEQHANANDAIEALQAKVGVNSSAVTTSLDYKVSQLETNAVSSGLVDAKGDLIVGTADNTVSRLAVGTNGYGLVADSAEASGLKWAAVGDVTTTGTQTLTNKTLTAPLIDGAAVIETFEYYGEPLYINRISLKNASTFYYGYLGDSSGYEVWWDYPADMPLAGVLGNSDRVDFRLIIGNTSGTDQFFNGISIGNGGNINQKYMNSQYIQTLQVGYTHIFDVTLVKPSTTWMAFIWYYKG